MFVWNNSSNGNQKLIDFGANAYSVTDENLMAVISKQQEEDEKEKYTQINLMDLLG